jgi:hypothetical protein
MSLSHRTDAFETPRHDADRDRYGYWLILILICIALALAVVGTIFAPVNIGSRLSSDSLLVGP